MMPVSKITPRRAPYKDFLQPALQRRFVLASALVLIISYLEAVLVGSWRSYIWAWFPVFRTCFFFFCAFPIVLLRIAHYHVGVRTASSPVQIIYGALFRAKSWEIVITYGLFGWLFSQVYLWDAGDRTGLQWISYAHHSGDRARLNEKPILFSTFFLSLGVAHGLFHIGIDMDRLLLGVVNPTRAKQHEKDREFSLTKTLNSKLPTILTAAIATSGLSLIFHLAFYALYLRPTAWGWTLYFLRTFYNLPKSNMLPNMYPYHLWLFFRMFYVGFLLSFLWITANMGFSILMKTEPLKLGKPITSESKDKNGSLLNGLKSKKLSVKCFAMWELAFIARDFKDRRNAIFEDIDRKDGPMWSEVCQVCLDLLTGIQGNVDSFATPPVEPKIAPSQEEPRQRVATPLHTGEILVQRAARDDLVSHVQKGLTSFSQSPGKTPLHRVSHIPQKAITEAKDRYLSKEQQQAMTPDGIQGAIRTQVAKIINTCAGHLIRRDFGLRLASAVFKLEQVEISLYMNAVNALTKLSVQSLSEDKYGQVQKDVANIIRTFTATVTKLDKFRAEFPSHWLDGKRSKKYGDVDELIEALKMCLYELVGSFEKYANDLKLSKADIRQAREAAHPREEEMEEAR